MNTPTRLGSLDSAYGLALPSATVQTTASQSTLTVVSESLSTSLMAELIYLLRNFVEID